MNKTYNFKVGDIVRYNGKGYMLAQAGATAKVTKPYNSGDRYVSIAWDKDSVLAKSQMDGNYYPEHFELVERKPAFWMVYGSGQGTPTYRHSSMIAAKIEAARLARLSPGIRFHVLAEQESVVAEKRPVKWS